MVFDDLEHLTPEELADQEHRWEVRAALYGDRMVELAQRIEALKAEQDQLLHEILRCHTNAGVVRLARKAVVEKARVS